MIDHTNRILIVDNSVDARYWLIESVAGPAGYITAEATNLLEARAQIATFDPHVVVVAAQLGNENGMQLVQDFEATLPMIVTTTRRSVDEMRAALQAGARDVLVKPFEAEEIAVAIARQLRVSQVMYKHKRLRRQSERQTQEFNAIYSIGQTITSSLDIEEILSQVVSAAVNLTQAEEGSLFLLDPDNGELYLRAHKNLDEAAAQHLRIQVNDTLIGSVIESGRALMLAGNQIRKLKTSFLVKSILAMPINVGKQPIGILSVDNKVSNQAFNEHDVHLLSILSDYAAIALENARLYWAAENDRRQLHTILRDTQDAVIVTDSNLRTILINRAAHAAFGLNVTRPGAPLSEVIDNRALLDLFEQGLAHEGSWRSEITLKDRRTLQGQFSHLSGIGYGVVLQDISQLKELDEIKSEFIATVSHDLRTPLTTIRGYVELLSRVGPLNEMQHDFVGRIERSMADMVELISDLLNLSRIEAGLDWEMEPTDLHSVVWDCAVNMQQSASDKHQTLNLNVPALAPVLGNAQRLKQVVGNLIGNAIKYTPEGGQIDVNLSTNNDFMTLTVSDNGIGIAPEHLQHVFDKFYRIKSEETEKISGTGLGLSIVKAIIERHKGRVWVDSEPGQGCTFTVLLPVYLAESNVRKSQAALAQAMAY